MLFLFSFHIMVSFVMLFGIKGLISLIHFPQRTKELDTPDLLRQLPALQQLLSRLLDCQVWTHVFQVIVLYPLWNLCAIVIYFSSVFQPLFIFYFSGYIDWFEVVFLVILLVVVVSFWFCSVENWWESFPAILCISPLYIIKVYVSSAESCIHIKI